MTALHKILLGLGLLTAIVVPLAVATFLAWEWRILCWLDRRRRERSARPPRLGMRWAR